jgi:hypothetical protein
LGVDVVPDFFAQTLEFHDAAARVAFNRRDDGWGEAADGTSAGSVGGEGSRVGVAEGAEFLAGDAVEATEAAGGPVAPVAGGVEVGGLGFGGPVDLAGAAEGAGSADGEVAGGDPKYKSTGQRY